MKLPKKLRFMGQVWSIEAEEIEEIDGEKYVGLHELSMRSIKIHPGQVAASAGEVLLHEVVHVIDRACGLDLTEHQISGLAFCLIAIASDNKWFTQLIDEGEIEI